VTSSQIIYFGSAAVISLVMGGIAATGWFGGNPSLWWGTTLGLFWMAGAWRLGFRLMHVPLTAYNFRSGLPALVSATIFVVVAWGVGLLLKGVGWL